MTNPIFNFLANRAKGKSRTDPFLNSSPTNEDHVAPDQLSKQLGIDWHNAFSILNSEEEERTHSRAFYQDYLAGLPVSGPHPSVTSKYGPAPYTPAYNKALPYSEIVPDQLAHNKVSRNFISGKYDTKSTSGSDDVVSSFDQDIATAPAGPTAGVSDNAGVGMFGEDYGNDIVGGDASDSDSSSSAAASGNNSEGNSSDSDYGDGQDWSGVDFSGWGFPVVLDLNNDGIAIIPLSESTARFDLAGTGSRQVLAWPGPEDALFVYDRDGDRLISHKDEIAFKDYLKTAKTDLEGLAWFDQLAQGGNEDGILDDRDAAWSKFGVWRDADQDGVTDEGELRMTGDGSPKSLNLSSDGQRRNVGPDARSFGRGTYEYIDHNGIVQTADHYDVALRLEKEKATAKALYPSHGEAKRPLPPLMRLDGQPQTAGERMYPMMAYNQERHVRWPDWAVQKVIKYNPSRTAELARR